MALIDVSDLLLDPDFTDTAQLIRRTSSVNGQGINEIVEVQSDITVVVQDATPEMLEKLPDSARLSAAIAVYYRGVLTAESSGGYSDVILWNGKRWEVKEIPEDFQNYGAGFTVGLCVMEAVNNG